MGQALSYRRGYHALEEVGNPNLTHLPGRIIIPRLAPQRRTRGKLVGRMARTGSPVGKDVTGGALPPVPWNAPFLPRPCDTMIIERRRGGLLVKAPAKLNLFLEVLGRRADGYHEIATLMVAVTLQDELELTARSVDSFDLSCDEPGLSAGPDNLVSRAAAALRQRTGCNLGAAANLRKRIPLAAGLAGGSTDAAAALAGLNELWGLSLPTGELASLGAGLGSDVPFFFSTPAAWCTGRGEQVEPIPLGGPLWFVIGCPARGLSTAQVYGRTCVPATARDGARIRRALAEGDPSGLGMLLHNRLEGAAEGLCPQIADLREELSAMGLAGVRMSGSGSSVFGLCRDESQALEAADRLRQGRDEARRVFVVRTCP